MAKRLTRTEINGKMSRDPMFAGPTTSRRARVGGVADPNGNRVERRADAKLQRRKGKRQTDT